MGKKLIEVQFKNTGSFGQGNDELPEHGDELPMFYELRLYDDLSIEAEFVESPARRVKESLEEAGIEIKFSEPVGEQGSGVLLGNNSDEGGEQ